MFGFALRSRICAYCPVALLVMAIHQMSAPSIRFSVLIPIADHPLLVVTTVKKIPVDAC